MTEPLPQRSGVELLDVHQLRLVEAAAPAVSSDDRLAMDRTWDETVRANPNLFDGPVAACAGLAWDAPHSLVISWARTTYRRYALRRVPGATAWLPSLFVSVAQATHGGCLLVGRMSSATAVPGRWQLPGGSVEPPADHEPLDVSGLRWHAARELAEETGIDTPPEDLTRWLVTRGEYGNVGVVFLAAPRPASVLHERFTAVVSAERASGRDPELDRIALIRSPAELPGLGGPQVDYLEPIIRRYATMCPSDRDPPATV